MQTINKYKKVNKTSMNDCNAVYYVAVKTSDEIDSQANELSIA